MKKIRFYMFLLTIAVVAVVGSTVFLFARGVRFNPTTRNLQASGLFVAKSNPDGAQVFLNGELETATNATINLVPGSYDVEIRKDGYKTWSKRLTIEQEVVTEINATLFRSAPSLTAITFASAENPVAAPGLTKILYVVPATADNIANDREGLWLLETLNLPIGFTQEPKRITNGDLTGASLIFSPNENEVMVQLASSVYLLDLSRFTSQSQRVNIVGTYQTLLSQWELEHTLRLSARLKKLPKELEEFLAERTQIVVFSPDEDKVMYLASADFTIPDNLISQLPGSSTQPQDRSVKVNHTYIYDIKEDRNFLLAESAIAPDSECITSGEIIYLSCASTLSWYPTSLNLLQTNSDSLTIMDYDGTNKQNVYAGSYVAPFAFATSSANRIVLLTNLGANSDEANLYSLAVR